MGRLTFTLDTEEFSSGGEDIKQLAEDIQAFINILHHTSPDYIEAGNILQAQLDEQMQKFRDNKSDPREKFCKKLDEMCPYIMPAMQDEELKNLYTELRNQIGEAMGPVSYAAYKLAQKLSKCNCSVNWVWDFVNYYEENWEF